jgi:hypothetical protein
MLEKFGNQKNEGFPLTGMIVLITREFKTKVQK